MKGRLLAAIVAMGFSLGAARAADLRVPQAFATLELALAAAQSGDTVYLAAGTYDIAATVIVPDGVAVAGAGPGRTVLRGQADPLLSYTDLVAPGGLRDLSLIGAEVNTLVGGFGPGPDVARVVFGLGRTCLASDSARVENSVFGYCQVGFDIVGQSPRVFNNVFAKCATALRLSLRVTGDPRVPHAFADPVIGNNVFFDNETGIQNQTGSPDNEFTRVPGGNLFDGNDLDVRGFTLDAQRNATGFPAFVAWSDDSELGNDDFHLFDASSPAIDVGEPGEGGIRAPTDDVDGDPRPLGAGFDAGIDEYADLDGDGLPDARDDDDDGDSIPDDSDGNPKDTDNDGQPNYTDPDDDNDEMTDVFEAAYGLNPLDPADAHADPDGDGQTNVQEFRAGTNPLSAPPPQPESVGHDTGGGIIFDVGHVLAGKGGDSSCQAGGAGALPGLLGLLVLAALPGRRRRADRR